MPRNRYTNAYAKSLRKDEDDTLNEDGIKNAVVRSNERGRVETDPTQGWGSKLNAEMNYNRLPTTSDLKKMYGNQWNKTSRTPVEFGNVDLNDRPILHNDDGTISTVNSISIRDGDNEVLIPTVGTKDGKPYQMTDDEAIENYYRTGQHLGKFRTVEEANRFAERLHRDQERKYGG